MVMNAQKLTDVLSVAPQIAPDDLAEIAAAGFKSIISNRPDGEGADQPAFADIERAAHAHGLLARYLPVVSGKVTDADVEAVKTALANLPSPIIAYCKSGTRCTTLWALAEAGQRPVSDILSRAKCAGFNMSGVASRITDRGKSDAAPAVAHHDIVIVGGREWMAKPKIVS